VKSAAVGALGLLALALFLAGEGTRRLSPEERGVHSLQAVRDLDDALRESLRLGVGDSSPLHRFSLGEKDDQRSPAFDHLETLLPSFPSGTGLELLDESGAPVAWAGLLPAETWRKAPPKRMFLPSSPGEDPGQIRRSGIQVLLGRIRPIPRANPPLFLAAWIPLDLADPSLRRYFPQPTLAQQLSETFGTRVQILPRLPSEDFPEAQNGLALPVTLPGFKGGDGPAAVVLIGREEGLAPSRPGPLTSLAGGVAVLCLAFVLLGPLLRRDRPYPLLRFGGFLVLCVGLRAALRILNFPGAFIGGTAFDPSLFRAPTFLGTGDTAGDFLVTTILATVGVLAFLSRIPPLLHRGFEASRWVSVAAVILLPLSVPLFSLALGGWAAEFVAGATVAEFVAGSPVDLFPAGRINLPLAGTLLLFGFFLLTLCFTLLGTASLHGVFRALRARGEGRAAVLTFLSGALATVLVLGIGGWAGVTILVPAGVLLLLHPVHLRLRHEGVTALHTGVFLLAATLAAFPALWMETWEAKRSRVASLTQEAACMEGELRSRLKETVQQASGPWRGAVPKDAPHLPFVLWAKSELTLPGISTSVRTFDPEKGSTRVYGKGLAPGSWNTRELSWVFPEKGEIVPVEIRGRKVLYTKAVSPDIIRTNILAGWDWPQERPAFPPPALPGPALAFALYEGNRLVRSTQPGWSQGRPLPQKIERASGESRWIREEYPHWSAKVFYTPGPRPGMVVSAAMPVPPLWGEVLGFLRLFLSGVVCATIAFLGYAVWRGCKTGRWGFHRRLKYRLMVSFGLISVLPIFLLGSYTESETVDRIRKNLEDQTRRELDLLAELFHEEVRILDMGVTVDDPVPGLTVRKLEGVISDQELRKKADASGAEWDMYLPDPERRMAEPFLRFSSREDAVRNQLIPRRVPAGVYQALVLGGEGYRFERETWGAYLIVKGFRRILDRDLQTAGVLATSRFIPTWFVDAMIAGEVSFILTLYLLSLIAVGFFGLILARRIAWPLEKLTEATRAVAEGNLEHRVHLTSKDEIGDLVDSFNLMTAQLGESREAMVRAEKESAWREMARQIAHEIKNPLTPMKLSAQHIARAHRDRSEKFGEILQEGIRRITEQIDALGRIAQEFSDFARFPKRDPKPQDLNLLIREAVRLLAEEAGAGEEEGRITFREVYEDSLPPVTADEDEIRRVMINLLRNAIQAMADGGGEVAVSTRQVRSGARRDGEKKKGQTRVIGSAKTMDGEQRSAEVRVTDTGPGIPEALRDKLFQPYFSTKSGGTGLGLAICKKAVDEMGGEIVIESEEGVGTTVILRLPLSYLGK
jgi:signal transduction histidine kinase